MNDPLIVPQREAADRIRVLVVDDDPDIVETLADILTSKGYEVATAGSFDEALDKAQRTRFDVALVDVRLNDAVGTDLLARLRELNEDLAGIMMTAFGTVYTSMKAIEYGATAYLLKPLEIDKLLATIEKGVESKRSVAENRRMVHQLSAINSVAAAVNQSLDLDRIVENTIRQMKVTLQPDAAWIFLIDESQSTLILKAQYGMDAVAQDVMERPFRVGEGLMGQVAATGQPLVIPERADQDPRVTRPFWRKLKANSVAAVPILGKDSVLGVLGLAMCGERTRVFSADDTIVLEGMAAQVGLAIENAQMYAEVQRLAMIDELTGLSNRRHFFNALDRELARAIRHRETFGLIMFDLDDFKQFNDRYGHLAGDEALQHLADSARNAVRRMDLIGRYGGEEFVILLPETGIPGAMEVAERLRAEASKVDGLPGGTRLTISVGVAVYPTHATDVDGLIRVADQALYKAKREGKNRVVLADKP